MEEMGEGEKDSPKDQDETQSRDIGENKRRRFGKPISIEKCFNALAWLLEEGSASCTAVCLVGNKLLIADNGLHDGTRENDNGIIKFQIKCLGYLSKLDSIHENEDLKKNFITTALLIKIKSLFNGRLTVSISEDKLKKIAEVFYRCRYQSVDSMVEQLKQIYPGEKFGSLERLYAIFAFGAKLMKRLGRVESYLRENPTGPLYLALKKAADPLFLRQSFYGAVNLSDQQYLLGLGAGCAILLTNQEGGHAELKIVDYLLAARLITLEKQINAPYLIGVSKKCCLSCYQVINWINTHLEKTVIKVTGGHRLTFKGWSKKLPIFLLKPEKEGIDSYQKGLYYCADYKAMGYYEMGDITFAIQSLEEITNVDPLKVYLYRDYKLLEKIPKLLKGSKKIKKVKQENHPMSHSSSEDDSMEKATTDPSFAAQIELFNLIQRVKRGIVRITPGFISYLNDLNAAVQERQRIDPEATSLVYWTDAEALKSSGGSETLMHLRHGQLDPTVASDNAGKRWHVDFSKALTSTAPASFTKDLHVNQNYFAAMAEALQQLGSYALPESEVGDADISAYLKSIFKNDEKVIIANERWNLDIPPEEREKYFMQIDFSYEQFLEFLINLQNNEENSYFVLPINIKGTHYCGLAIGVKKSLSEDGQLTITCLCNYINPTGGGGKLNAEDTQAYAAITQLFKDLQNVIIPALPRVNSEGDLQDPSVGELKKSEKSVNYITIPVGDKLDTFLQGRPNIIFSIENLSCYQQCSSCDCGFIVAQTLVDIVKGQALTIPSFSISPKLCIEQIAQTRAFFSMDENIIRDQYFLRFVKALVENQAYSQPLRQWLLDLDISQYDSEPSKYHFLSCLEVAARNCEMGIDGFKNMTRTGFKNDEASTTQLAYNFIAEDDHIKKMSITDLKMHAEWLLVPHFEEQGGVIFKLNPELLDLELHKRHQI